MKKEEFPTFLNEQPTFIFGRTMREVLLVLLGLTFAYLVWVNLGLVFRGPGLALVLLKGLFAVIPIVAAVAIAFVNIGSRPLEEWLMVAIFYVLTPKLFIYIPIEEGDETGHTLDVQQYQRNMQLDEDNEGEDDD